MLKEILKQFCVGGTTAIRTYMKEPWSRGEYTYATNGHILIRIPKDESIPENEKCPESDSLFEKSIQYAVGQEYIPVPMVELPVLIDCDECYGEGEKECGECGYTNKCDDCDGSGKAEILIKFEIQNNLFDQKYINKISQLPNCTICATEKGEAAHFKFDGGDGLLMPMRY